MGRLTPESGARPLRIVIDPVRLRSDGAPPSPLRQALGLLRFAAWLALGSSTATAQEAAPAPVVDTILVERSDPFPPEVAESSFLYRGMNSIHVVTSESVIRRELLFEKGHPLDSSLVAESERNLRRLRLFREVAFDTLDLDGRLGVRIRTRDGWSLKPKFKIGAASDGTLTATLGVNETNLLGTGNQAYVAYDKQVDRDGLNASASFSRPFGSAIDLRGNYAGLSDGRNGNWFVGLPLRSVRAPFGLEHNGLAADQDVIRYRAGAEERDSTLYRREALLLALDATRALSAGSRGFVRAGVHGELRKESYRLVFDSVAAIPDSSYGMIGIFGEAQRTRFWTVERLNGFGEEDVDLSSRVRISVNIASASLGYARGGVGPGIAVATGAVIGGGRGYVWGALDANALWSSAGLDSARVLATASAGWKPAPDHATVFQVQGGLLDGTPPGSEFDLGYTSAPRSWEPHSFVGTRGIWGTLEHRWFKFDGVLQLADIALAAFVDYGGAWYDDQDARFGGNLGFGLRSGSSLSSVATTGRLDVAWRFGDGVERGDSFVVSLGAGFVFPRRSVPAISYRAEAPS